MGSCKNRREVPCSLHPVSPSGNISRNQSMAVEPVNKRWYDRNHIHTSPVLHADILCVGGGVQNRSSVWISVATSTVKIQSCSITSKLFAPRLCSHASLNPAPSLHPGDYSTPSPSVILRMLHTQLYAVCGLLRLAFSLSLTPLRSTQTVASSLVHSFLLLSSILWC